MMDKSADRRAIFYIAAGFILFSVTILLDATGPAPAIAAGYVIGALVIVLHYIIGYLSVGWSNETFFAVYTPLTLLRMLLAIGVYIGVIIWGIFDQFSFTVSFLISYLYHSVINIFLLNKRTNKPG